MSNLPNTIEIPKQNELPQIYISIFKKGGETQKLPLRRHYHKKIRKLPLPRPPIIKKWEEEKRA